MESIQDKRIGLRSFGCGFQDAFLKSNGEQVFHLKLGLGRSVLGIIRQNRIIIGLGRHGRRRDDNRRGVGAEGIPDEFMAGEELVLRSFAIARHFGGESVDVLFYDRLEFGLVGHSSF